MVTRKLTNLFNHFRDRPFVFVAPGGNAGDHLIYRGAGRLASIAGIRYDSMTCTQFLNDSVPANAVLYVHGSGGFNPWWSGTPMEILSHAAATHSGPLIVGPSTFHPDPEFLESTVSSPLREAVCDPIHLFARELVSKRALEQILPAKVHLHHDHDTALSVDPDDLDLPSKTYPYTLFGIRTDKEAVDLPSTSRFELRLDPAAYCPEFEHWMQLHASVEALVTNRLHSAILGAVLEKPTTLLPNSYFKNRAVWTYSLEDRGVIWQDSLPASSESRWSLDGRLESLLQHALNRCRLARMQSSVLP